MTTESDRELLELAAKASGIPIIPCTCRHERWPFKHDEARSGKSGHWNPLEDDGDALRLAVKLGLFTDTGLTYQFMEAKDCESTRRAIVRAAAEVARATHKEQT